MDDENKKPTITYWTTKFHKRFSNNRFAIDCYQCSIKLLPKAMNAELKLLYKQTENFNSKFHVALKVY